MANRTSDGPMDDLTTVKEILRVQDEVLQNLAQDLRKRDSTIKEIADKLSEIAEAVEAAASAAHTMNEQSTMACAKIERLMKISEDQLESSRLKEAHIWCFEVVKAREYDVILEAAVVKAEEKLRVAEVDAEARIKEAVQKGSAALKDKEELLAYVNKLQAQLHRFVC